MAPTSTTFVALTYTATLCALAAAVYWWPKWQERTLSAYLGRTMTLLGFTLLFFLCVFLPINAKYGLFPTWSSLEQLF